MKRYTDFINKLFNSRFYHIICFLFIFIYYCIGFYDISILENSEELCFLLCSPGLFYVEYVVLNFLVNIIKRS